MDRSRPILCRAASTATISETGNAVSRLKEERTVSQLHDDARAGSVPEHPSVPLSRRTALGAAAGAGALAVLASVTSDRHALAQDATPISSPAASPGASGVTTVVLV